MADLMKRNWKCIIYPDDIGPHWLELLDDVGVPMLVSPLHDSDLDEDGNKKKPHRHVLISLTAKQKYSVVLGWMLPLGVKILKEVRDVRRDERYWCHLDSPAKAQYSTDELIPIGGYVCKYLGERYEQNTLTQIMSLIDELGLVDYADLGHELYENYPELFLVFVRYPAFFNNYMHSRLQMSKASSDNNTYVKYGFRRRRFSY